MKPIYIASKGRPHGATLRTLHAEGVPFTVLVEQQDYPAYVAEYGVECVYNIGCDDIGFAKARREVLQLAALHQDHTGWFWMLDDDISKFSRVHGGKLVRTPVKEVLREAETLLRVVSRLGQISLEYGQFAWSAKKPCILNSYCDVAVAINLEAVHEGDIGFRDGADLKLDRDFTLQMLAAGYQTARAQTVAFNAPKNASNTGGLQSAYAQNGREAASSRWMAKAWPGICTVQTKNDGRVDAKINWRVAAQLGHRHVPASFS